MRVVDARTERIEAVNPAIDAVIADRSEAARREARAAEDALVRGEPPAALHGVPFTAKEMVSVRGMPHTFGTLDRIDHAAQRDATVVTRLRAAGAIPLGVTNVPEWGFRFETDNLLYGRTRNPYDASRTSGGNSGGEGASVERLDDDGLPLMAPHPRVAPKHRRPLLRPFDFAYTAALNIFRVPVTVAPVGFDAAGLPLAVQIAGARGDDHVTIAAAGLLEDAFGGWRPALPATAPTPTLAS